MSVLQIATFSCALTAAVAEAATIRIIELGSADKGIPGVAVSLEDPMSGMQIPGAKGVTDENGNVSLQIPPGTKEVKVVVEPDPKKHTAVSPVRKVMPTITVEIGPVDPGCCLLRCVDECGCVYYVVVPRRLSAAGLGEHRPYGPETAGISVPSIPEIRHESLIAQSGRIRMKLRCAIREPSPRRMPAGQSEEPQRLAADR